jgi:CBS domain-containing protein
MARYVGNMFNHGVYEIGMELKNFPYLEHHVHHWYDLHTTKEIMTKDVVTLNEYENAGTVEQILNTTSHNGFPVVDDLGRFKGIIRRDQLVALLECRLFAGDKSGRRAAAKAQAASAPQDPPEPRRATSLSSYPTTTASISTTSAASNIDDAGSHDEEDTSLLDMSNMSDESRLMKKSMSFISDSTYIALAAGNDCDFARHRSKDVRARSNSDGASSPRRSHNRDSELLDSAYLIKDDRYDDRIVQVNEDDDVAQAIRVDGMLVIKLTDEDKFKTVDISSVMNVAPHVVLDSCPLSRMFRLFTTLGLRHLVVLNDTGRVAGIVTRCNLLEDVVKSKLHHT